MIETIVRLMGRSEWKSGRYLKVVDGGVLKYYNFKSQPARRLWKHYFWGVFLPSTENVT